jgi:hypothetical protein
VTAEVRKALQCFFYGSCTQTSNVSKSLFMVIHLGEPEPYCDSASALTLVLNTDRYTVNKKWLKILQYAACNASKALSLYNFGFKVSTFFVTTDNVLTRVDQLIL